MADVSPAPAAPATDAAPDKAPSAVAPVAGKPTGKGNAGNPNLGHDLAGGSAKAPAPEKSATPEAPAKVEWWKHLSAEDLKVDGKPGRIPKSEAEAKMMLQKAMAADRRLEDVAKQRKEIESQSKQMRDALAMLRDPEARSEAWKIITGEEWEKSAIDTVANLHDRDQMTPEQRELAEYKQKVARYEKDKAEAATRAQQEQERSQKAAYEQHVTDTCIKAIEVLGFDAKGADRGFIAEYALNQAADEIAALEEAGIDVTPEKVAARLDAHMDRIRAHSLKGLQGNALLKALGQDVLSRVVQAIRASKTAPPPEATPAVPLAEAPPADESPRRTTAAEQRRLLSNISSASSDGMRKPFRW